MSSEQAASTNGFGHNMLKHFPFEPGYINLNNGSFGCLPNAVRASCDALTTQIESNPDKFARLTYAPLLSAIRTRVSTFLHANADEIALVPNVNAGLTTVLRTFPWRAGDAVLMSDITYDSIARSVRSVAALAPFPRLELYTLAFPASHRQIVDLFRARLREVKNQLAPNARIVVLFDAVCSNPGVLMPWREIIRVCKEESGEDNGCEGKVYSLVDGAHVIGQDVNLNLHKDDPDFFVTSCSKWLFAKRGCSLLYVPKRNHALVPQSVPPSLGYLPLSESEVVFTWSTSFWYLGSTDLTSGPSILYALDFRESLGGEEVINDYTHKLALAGGKHLAQILGTRVMSSPDATEDDDELIGSMVNVELPLPRTLKPSAEIVRQLHWRLLEERKVYAAHFWHNGAWWVRVSAQIFNEIEDFEKLGHALIGVCREIVAIPGINGD